jgi:hypothetical protein
MHRLAHDGARDAVRERKLLLGGQPLARAPRATGDALAEQRGQPVGERRVDEARRWIAPGVQHDIAHRITRGGEGVCSGGVQHGGRVIIQIGRRACLTVCPDGGGACQCRYCGGDVNPFRKPRAWPA